MIIQAFDLKAFSTRRHFLHTLTQGRNGPNLQDLFKDRAKSCPPFLKKVHDKLPRSSQVQRL